MSQGDEVVPVRDGHPEQDHGLSHVPKGTTLPPHRTHKVPSLVEDIDHLLMTLPMTEGQRKVMLRASLVLKKLGYAGND